MNNKIFITGANGFIGQKLVDFLSNKDFLINALVREKSIPGFKFKDNVKVVIGDLLDIKSLEEGIDEKSIVINLAANPYHPTLSYKVNVGGTLNLVNVCKKKNVSLLLHISSQATKIEKKGVYADSKSLSDEIIKKSGLRYVIVKPSLVYGSGEKGLFNKIKKLVTMVPMIPVFGDGMCKVNPISTDDFNKYIEAIISDKSVDKEVFDLGSEEKISYNKLYQEILKKIGSKAVMLHIPVWVGLMFGRLFRLIKMANPPFFIDNVLGSTQETNCDPSKIVKKYGIKIANFKSGMEAIFDSRKTNVAIVGLGKMGLLHISVLSSMDDVKIVALVDSNPKLFSMIRSMGVSGNFYNDLSVALKKEKIDAVYVLTPTYTHLPLLKTLIKNNKNVFVEKPATMNDDEVSKLEKLAKGYSKNIAVGYTLLFKRCFGQLKKIIESEKYGLVKSFQMVFEHGEVFGEKKGWMFDKNKSGGGVMMNPGPHLFSLINYFFGKPKKINGSIESIFSKQIEDKGKFVLNYGDFVGDVSLSWSVEGKDIPTTEIKIEFEKATIEATSKKLVIISNGDKKELLEMEIEPLIEGAFDINPEANGEAYFIEDRLFIDCVQGKNKLLINSLKFALDSEKLIFNCYRTAK